MLINNRKFLTLLFTDTFTVTTKTPQLDATTKRTTFVDTVSGSNVGRVSFSTIRPTETNGLTEVKETVVLFTYPEIDIPVGSKISITRNGETIDYEQSGKPAIYDSHIEVPIELWREKA